MEEPALMELYSSVPSSSFSDDVLAVCPEHLPVLPGGDLGWSDLGESTRVLSVLRRKRVRPEWAHEWEVGNAAS
jgi:hypothetical protein